MGIRFDEMRWKGVVLGDSCLIEWKEGKAAFLTSQAGENFDNYPDYFDSSLEKKGKGKPKEISGELVPGSLLLLISDPFSEFLFAQYSKDAIGPYIEALQSLSSHQDFEELVEKWRQEGMHNDDTSLIVVEYDGDCSFHLDSCDDLSKLKNPEMHEQKQEEQKQEEQVPQDDCSSPDSSQRDEVQEAKASQNDNTFEVFLQYMVDGLRRIVRYKSVVRLWLKFKKEIRRIVDECN